MSCSSCRTSSNSFVSLTSSWSWHSGPEWQSTANISQEPVTVRRPHRPRSTSQPCFRVLPPASRVSCGCSRRRPSTPGRTSSSAACALPHQSRYVPILRFLPTLLLPEPHRAVNSSVARAADCSTAPTARLHADGYEPTERVATQQSGLSPRSNTSLVHDKPMICIPITCTLHHPTHQSHSFSLLIRRVFCDNLNRIFFFFPGFPSKK